SYEDTLRSSVCLGVDPKTPQCDAGMEAARGDLHDQVSFLYGEHTYITYEALKLIGLDTFAEQSFAIPRYYSVIGDATGTNQPTLEPASWGSESYRQLQRSILLPEVSQLPDVSYSLSDYLLGNEHCLAGDPLQDLSQRSGINKCHDFAPDMGSVNSNHFWPQNKSMYELYHGAALEVAA